MKKSFLFFGIITLLVVLSFFGAISLITLGHEFVHILQSKAPESICWTLGNVEGFQTGLEESNYTISKKVFLRAFVVHDVSQWEGYKKGEYNVEYNKWKKYSEEWATDVMYVLVFSVCLFFGFLGGYLGYSLKKRKF